MRLSWPAAAVVLLRGISPTSLVTVIEEEEEEGCSFPFYIAGSCQSRRLDAREVGEVELDWQLGVPPSCPYCSSRSARPHAPCLAGWGCPYFYTCDALGRALLLFMFVMPSYCFDTCPCPAPLTCESCAYCIYSWATSTPLAHWRCPFLLSPLCPWRSSACLSPSVPSNYLADARTPHRWPVGGARTVLAHLKQLAWPIRDASIFGQG